MKIDNSFYKRIAIARTALGLTQSQLADMVGIVRRQIAAYEAGDSKPRDKVLQNLAAALGTSMEWLSTGNGQGPDVNHIKRTVTVREIPVLSWGMAMTLLDYDASPAHGAPSIKDYIPAPSTSISENAFAIEISGDSMACSGPVSFPDGTVVIFEPYEEAFNGDFVFCKFDDDFATFKQLVQDQGQKFLRSLNPAYPLISIKNVLVKGVAVHSQTSLSRAYPIDIGHPDISACKSSTSLVSQDYDSRLSSLENKLDKILEAMNNNKTT
ncbi:LexA family protein [Pantoea agglomerans]|uniref:LexA family protein n=1 Tax=Enterobacter agglomerans TaxID=549 RepID=UPI002413742A|nr:S24 family peptidase [Pantoea agglomerans]